MNISMLIKQTAAEIIKSNSSSEFNSKTKITVTADNGLNKCSCG
jgi:hypothetical protein